MMACRVVVRPGQPIAITTITITYIFLLSFSKNNLEHQISRVGRLEGGLDTIAFWQRLNR